MRRAEAFCGVRVLFFERPHELKQQHPALYDEFRQYYRQDPAERAVQPKSGNSGNYETR